MKFYKVVVGVLVITMPVIAFVVYAKKSNNSGTKDDRKLSTTVSKSTDKSVMNLPTTLSSKAIENLMKKTDSRVAKVKDIIKHEYYKDYCERETPVFRYLDNDVDHESFAQYFMYYDVQGKLICAEITHYRAAQYTIYFNNDEWLYMVTGIIGDSEPFISDDMGKIKLIIKKEPEYAFVHEDISLILQYAYK